MHPLKCLKKTGSTKGVEVGERAAVKNGAAIVEYGQFLKKSAHVCHKTQPLCASVHTREMQV